MRVPPLAAPSKTATRAHFLASAVMAGEDALLADLFDSLALMRATDAHDILDGADALLAPRFRMHLDKALDAYQAARSAVWSHV